MAGHHVRHDAAGIEIVDADILDNADDLRELAVKGLRLQQALGIRAVDRGDPATSWAPCGTSPSGAAKRNQ